MRPVLSLRVLLVMVLCCVGVATATADGSRLALLPLDAPGKLAIYGQPVAAEIARSLGAAGLDVVVVGAQMAVPREAVLVIEGSILVVRKKVKVELRLRTLDSRTPLVTVTSLDAQLETLDRAASEAATLLLPLVQAELEKRKPARAVERKPARPDGEGREGPAGPSAPVARDQAPRSTAMIAITANGVPVAARPYFVERMMLAASALTEARWRPRPVEISQISPAMLLAMSATEPGSLGLAFDVRELAAVQQGGVFFGAVRARVLVVLGGKVIFDRELTTDTVVGARKGELGAMLDLLAREMTVILRPRYAQLLGEPLRPAAEAARAAAAAPGGAGDVRRAAR
jgi:hypothetical protein